MSALLWALIVILVLFWIAGLIWHLLGPLIHLALLAAAVLFIINMFMGRRPV